MYWEPMKKYFAKGQRSYCLTLFSPWPSFVRQAQKSVLGRKEAKL
jgi:hypothetical protein